LAQQTARLAMPLLQAAQAQKHVTHNAALERLDLLVQLTVQGFDETTPPLDPAEGEVWAVGTGAVNDWAGQDGALAAWSNGGWLFLVPDTGWRAALGREIRVFDGGNWVTTDLPPLQNLPGLGIATSHDATNRLAVAADATLFTHTGNGHQVKLNKAAPGDTASLLYQTAWSGRAEMGTTGSDDFAIKVSADGSAWFTALTADGTDGTVSLPSGAQVTGSITGTAVTQDALDPTAGRLTRVGDFGLGASDLAAVQFTDGQTDLPSGFYSGAGAGANPATYPDAGAVAYPFLNLARRVGAGDYGQVRVFFSDDAVSIVAKDDLADIWTTRHRLLSLQTLLGTVAETGGFPTGAVIERGSNVDGDYVRLADGTQVCTRTFDTQSCTTASGALFSNAAEVGWTFPVLFAAGSVPAVSGSAGQALRLLGIGAASESGVGFRVLSTISDATGHAPTLTAIGRWF
jgi:hypothetical protein